jgi:hypothetical protein
MSAAWYALLTLTRFVVLAAVYAAMIPLLQCVTLQGALIAKGGNMTGMHTLTHTYILQAYTSIHVCATASSACASIMCAYYQTASSMHRFCFQHEALCTNCEQCICVACGVHAMSRLMSAYECAAIHE